MAPAKLPSASPASRITVRLVRLPAISTGAPTETSAPSIPKTGIISDVAENNPKAMAKDEVAAAACGAPNNAGSASGFLEQALQGSARKAQRCANQHREQGTRQPDFAHDDRGRPVAIE